jgi:uncharacterized membrane protein
MTAPVWALTLAYWLHMLATIVWVGGLAALALLVLPARRKALDQHAFSTMLEKMQHRLDAMGWMSLAVLTGTGLFQMSAHPAYQGFLSIESRWAGAILAKHLVFVGMIAVSAYMTWGLMPRLRRINLLEMKGQATAQGKQRLNAANDRLLRTNLVLAIIVLALTALARVS